MNKILFSGPPGAGKTTAIAAVSDVPVVSTEQKATDAVKAMKEATTVAMDYGQISVEGGKVHLYGTPGQKRFDYMWNILSKGAVGLVLLMSNTSADPLQELEEYVSAFRDFVNETDLVVGVTRMDEAPRPGLRSYQERLQSLGLNVPVVEVDARAPEDIRTLLMLLLTMLDPTVKR